MSDANPSIPIEIEITEPRSFKEREITAPQRSKHERSL